MATWKRKRADTETTLKMETKRDETQLTISTVNDVGRMFAWDSINIPLETLKEMVNAQ